MTCKNLILSALILMLGPSLILGQDDDFSLESLKAPSMPSATIIGSQINEVNEPKSLKALEATFISNYVDDDQNIVLPNNFALELNPFMLSGRKNFNYFSYIEKSDIMTPVRNFSISFASTTDFIINDTTSSNALGVGFRTLIYRGKINEELKSKYILSLQENTDNLNIKTSIGTLIRKYLKECSSDTSCNIDSMKIYVIENFRNGYIKNKIDELAEQTKYSPEVLNLEAIINSVVKTLEMIPADQNKEDYAGTFKDLYDENYSDVTLSELRKYLEEINNYSYGFRVELNYANAINFPTNNFEDYISSRWGLWTNISYRHGQIKDAKVRKNGSTTYKGHPSNFEFIGLGRIIRNNEDFINTYSPADTSYQIGNVFDVGLRCVFEYKKLSLGIEYIHRINRNKISVEVDNQTYSRWENNDTKKYLLNVNYSLSDNIVLSYNIGKNFDSPFNESGNLITNLTLNFGFGDIKSSELINN